MFGMSTYCRPAILAGVILGSAMAFLPGNSSAQAPLVQSAQKRVARVAGESVYYYNGSMRVDLVLALDELVLSGGAVSAADRDASLKSASSRVLATEPADASGKALLVKFAAVAARGDLESMGKTLSAACIADTVRPVLYSPTDLGRKPEQRKLLTSQLSLKLRSGGDIKAITGAYGLEVLEKVTYSPDTYILKSKDSGLLASLEAANRIYESGKAEFATPQISRQQSKRLTPNDPLYNQQWHLKNTGSNPLAYGAIAGNDVNAEPAWNSYDGSGVNIAITDDGLEVAHADLASNARTDIDIDINYGDNDPSPSGFDDHGTACAGVAGARGNNSVGVSGAAPKAGLVGVRLISLASTDAQEAQGMQHQATAASPADLVHVNSNSWGPYDDAMRLETFGPLTKSAVEYAIANGREGRGTIFTWAAGNGLTSNDNVNYDGYASSRYTIAVGATGATGRQSWYSEPGASMLVNTPSNYSESSGVYGGITTVDRTGSSGYSSLDYDYDFGGTSSACPLAAGCIAGVLQANRYLTWRDVQHLLVNTSTKNDATDAGWFNNAAGKHFNHKYGFGRINLGAAIASAPVWRTVPPNATPLTVSEAVAVAIPDNNPTGISRTLAISGSPLFRTEHVEVTVNITHTYRGDVAMTLTSPSGTVSTLAAVHSDGGDNFSNWMMTTVANWGENPNGTWTLKVADGASDDTGTLNSLAMTVHGYVGAPTNSTGYTGGGSAAADWSPYY